MRFEIARSSLDEMKAFREYDRSRRREDKLRMNQLALPSHDGMGSAVGLEVVHRLKRRSARFQAAALREEEEEMNGGDTLPLMAGFSGSGVGVGAVRRSVDTEQSAKEEVLSAIEMVPDLDYQDENGDTALMMACGSRKQDGGGGGNESVVAAILAKGGGVNIRNKEGMTALLFAAKNGDDGIVRRLCQHGARMEVKGIGSKHTKTALLFAAENGHRVVVETLLSFGADLTARSDDDDANILMLSVNNNQLDTIRFILRLNEERGRPRPLDIDHQNKLGYTALMIAAYNGNQRVAEMLIQHRARLDLKNKGGETAYALARKARHLELCQLLLS